MSAHRARLPETPSDISQAPPGPRWPRPALGLTWVLAEHRLLERCRRRYGPTFSLNTWPMGFLVIISDPQDIKQMFTGDPEILRAGEGNAITEPVAGPESLLTLDGSRHMHRRKLMLPPFHGERLAVYEQLIGQIADEEIDSWSPGAIFPIHEALQRITLAVILRAVFGIEDPLQNAQLTRLLPKLINSPALLWPTLQHDLGRHSPWRRFLNLRKRVDELLVAEIERRRADSELAQRSDILSLLVGVRDDAGNPMTNEELRDQLVTLLLAGHETSATTLAWAFERLVRTPAVLERLRASLASGDEYLEWVLKETLRTRPIVPLIMRRATQDVPVGEHVAPAGSFLAASVILAHNNPEIYPNPQDFRPERFADGGSDTYTWIPFGGGVRRCIGASFAMLEMKIVLRRVLERCELGAVDQRPERPRRRFVTYAPQHGGRVRLLSLQPKTQTGAVEQPVIAA
jgi:cytochrome P450 family 135